MISLKEMESVLATIKEGSYTGAAKVLGYSNHSSVRHMVKGAERELGIELFERHGVGGKVRYISSPLHNDLAEMMNDIVAVAKLMIEAVLDYKKEEDFECSQ